MKLEQEQIKKIGLAGLVLGALLYGYFAYLLGPVQENEQKANSGIAALEPQIADAKKQIVTTADLEKKAPAATALLNGLKNSIPDGAPIAWFPPKIADYFKARGIQKVTTHLVSTTPDDMPGFRRMVWSVDVPKVEFVPLGIAISNLENTEPLLTVLNVTVDAVRDDAQYQHATLVVSTLVKS
ncbi:MAG TPA: hypothetical protein VHY22_03475 [Chthoniobacteraceae bacterium]|jgi:hypothetical protein|nr:hypothetical protein [Chthoniobacteraceae bacterium]